MSSSSKFADGSQEWHPLGDDLLLYLDGELPPREETRVRAHLDACWACRVKAEKIGATISAFVDYRSRVLLPSLPPLHDSGVFYSRLHDLASEDPKRTNFGSALLEPLRRLASVFSHPIAMPSAAVATVLIVAISITYLWTPTTSAGQLLKKSSTIEQAIAADPAVVLHRRLRLEVRRSGDKKLLARRRIDLWHSGATGTTARRVYNEQNKLVAGEWSRREGPSTAYEIGVPAVTTKRATFDFSRQIWRADVSARWFEALLPKADQAQVTKSGHYFLLSYEPHPQLDNGLLKAVLTLRAADLRAIGLELLVGKGTTDPDPLAYSIVEDGFEKEPAAQSDARVFETDPELLATVVAGPDLMIQATYALDHIGAILGQQLTVGIDADHKLRIAGVVDTEAQKAEVLKALDPLQSNPAVVVTITTLAESARAQSSELSPASTNEGELPVSGASIPVYPQLSQYFEAQGVGPHGAEERIRQFSSETLSASSAAMRHAWVLKRLTESISAADLSRLDQAPRGQYLCMLNTHAQEVSRRAEALRRRLGPVFFAASTPAKTDASAKDLTAAIARLFGAMAKTDEAIQSNFSVMAGSTSSSIPEMEQVRDSLAEVQQMAAWIRTATANGCTLAAVTPSVP